MAYLSSITMNELEDMHKQENDPRIKTKLAAILHAKEGKALRKTEEMLRIPKSTIHSWIKRFDEEGYIGLFRREYVKKTWLTDEKKAEICSYVKGKTSRDVWRFIKENYGKEYHPRSIPRLLNKLGFSRIKPRKRHYKADKKKQERFKKDIKKVYWMAEKGV